MHVMPQIIIITAVVCEQLSSFFFLVKMDVNSFFYYIKNHKKFSTNSDRTKAHDACDAPNPGALVDVPSTHGILVDVG